MSTCPICERTFKSPSALKIHQNRKNPCTKEEVIKLKANREKVRNYMNKNATVNNNDDMTVKNNNNNNNANANTVNTFVRNCTVNNTFNNDINANIIMTEIDYEYYKSIEECKLDEPKYGVNYVNSIMNSCTEEDIDFIKDLINQPDIDELSLLIANFIIDHCSDVPIRNVDYWMPQDSILIRTIKVLVASSTTWNTYEFTNKLKCIAVKTFIEFLTQFMYSYVVEYIYKTLDSSLNPQLNVILKLMNDKQTLADDIYEKIKDSVAQDEKFKIKVSYGKY
jgi:hypothetical protein